MADTPDMIITGSKVLTMDPAQPRAEAIAIAGNTVMALGSYREISRLKAKGTKVIDVGGGTVIPGFVEAHMHLFAGAGELDHLHLTGVHGLDQLVTAIRRYADGRPGDDLLVAEQADYTILSETERVSRHHLDKALPDRPFMMYSPDHHTAWANTTALRQAGILNGRAIGVGNEIVMAADGTAQGELREGEAFGPVAALAKGGDRSKLGLKTGGEPDPAPSASERAADRAIMLRGLEHCAKHGITSLHNMDGNLYTLELLDELGRQGKQLCRARVPFHFKNFMQIGDLEKASMMSARYRSEKLASGFVKMFIDGVLDSWTAVMIEDYPDKPGWKGEPLFAPERFTEVATEIDRRGLQIAVHAIGDGGVRIVLDGYAAARRANGKRDSRHRIEHIEVVHPDDIPRFAELGVLASMQPPHPPGCAGLPLQPTVTMIGEARWPYAYAWRTLREAGARLVFGTDWPVSPIDPMAALKWATTRKLWKKGLPDQRQTLLEAIEAYTVAGAHAEFMEHRKGRLKPGMLADAVVLGGDIERIDPEGLDTVRPVVTICDGQVTFEA